MCDSIRGLQTIVDAYLGIKGRYGRPNLSVFGSRLAITVRG
jgi:hypothetical protein